MIHKPAKSSSVTRIRLLPPQEPEDTVKVAEKTNTDTAAEEEDNRRRTLFQKLKGKMQKTGKRLRESPIYFIKMGPMPPPPPPPPRQHFFFPNGLGSSFGFHQMPQQHQQNDVFNFARSPNGLFNYLPVDFRANGKPTLSQATQQHLLWQNSLVQPQMRDPFSFSGAAGGQWGPAESDIWAHRHKQRFMGQQSYQHFPHQQHQVEQTLITDVNVQDIK
jgi:hypothetical protein